MLETIVKFLADRGTLVQPEALDYLATLDNPMAKLKQGLARGHEIPFVLSAEAARQLTGARSNGHPEREPKQLPEPEPVQQVPGSTKQRPEPTPKAGTAEPRSRDAPTEAAQQAPPDPTGSPPAAADGAEVEQEASPEPDAVDHAEASSSSTQPTHSPSGQGAQPVQSSQEDPDAPAGGEQGNANDKGGDTSAKEVVVNRPAPKASSSEATEQANREHGSPGSPGSPPRFKDEVRRVADEVKILMDVTGDSICEGKIEDFTKLFRNRYNRMRRLFRKRREMVGATSITRLREGEQGKFIALVNEVRTTKNGHRIIELEDDTGEIVVLAPKDEDRLIELTDTLLLDEVVGIVGKKQPKRGRGDGLFIMEELVRPDVRLDRAKHTASDGSVLFVSDVHLGADTFLDEGWNDLLDWIPQQMPSQGGDLRYLIINGDLVEGVGIYPGQEDELHIGNVYDQCQAAADDLAGLPDELNIYILPGNHDPVRPAEPQPAFPEDIREMFRPNVAFVGNPCMLSLDGVEVLGYHGVSLFDYIEALSNCNIMKPIETMVEMLRRRHLCPIYGGKTPLAPEHKDYMIIDRVPDIFVTGHVHTAQTGEYRGTRLINASTWQEQTDYQRMMGFQPDPCKAFRVDLSSLAVETFLFDHAEGTGAVQVENPEAKPSLEVTT